MPRLRGWGQIGWGNEGDLALVFYHGFYGLVFNFVYVQLHGYPVVCNMLFLGLTTLTVPTDVNKLSHNEAQNTEPHKCRGVLHWTVVFGVPKCLSCQVSISFTKMSRHEKIFKKKIMIIINISCLKSIMSNWASLQLEEAEIILKADKGVAD